VTIQFEQGLAHAMLDAMETNIGASPVLTLRSGAQPGTCGAADSGTLIATIAMAADAFSNAASWAKAIGAAIQDLSADGGGTLGHWRIKTSGGTTKLQGSITATGGGGDMTIDNTSIASGQAVTVTGFTLSDANA
jgi:hypothetical protein